MRYYSEITWYLYIFTAFYNIFVYCMLVNNTVGWIKKKINQCNRLYLFFPEIIRVMWRIPAVPKAPSRILTGSVKSQIVCDTRHFFDKQKEKNVNSISSKFDLVSIFGFNTDGGLNTYKLEGFHICAFINGIYNQKSTPFSWTTLLGIP